MLSVKVSRESVSRLSHPGVLYINFRVQSCIKKMKPHQLTLTNSRDKYKIMYNSLSTPNIPETVVSAEYGNWLSRGNQ